MYYNKDNNKEIKNTRCTEKMISGKMCCAFGTERNDYYENQKIIGIGNGICDGGGTGIMRKYRW